MQRVQQYGSFLYCPVRDTLCFGRYTDKECNFDSCILDDPEYQKLKEKISENRMRHKDEPKEPEKKAKTTEELAWEEVYKKEAMARKLYRRNKPKVADALMAEAMYARRTLMAKRGKRYE